MNILKLRQGGSRSAGRYTGKDQRAVKERQIRIKNLLTEKLMKSIISDHHGGRRLDAVKTLQGRRISLNAQK